MLDNLTISYIKEIQEASAQNRLVTFVGAGASCDAGVPLWNGLVNQMASVLPQDIQAKYDNLQLAQLVRETTDEKTYYESVRKNLLQKVTCPNAIHDAILELNPCCIITTNYDTLLEEAALKKNQQFWVVSKDSDLPKNHGERLLVKMHGDLNSENIVLTENDYYDYSRNFPLIRSFVISQFVSKVVMFIGFSLSDINLKYILRELQSELGDKMQRAFLLTQDEPSPIELNNFKNRGINVLSITPKIAQDIINKLRLELRPDHFLSWRGRALVHQLGILKEYRDSNSPIDLLIDFFENQVQGLSVSGQYLKYAFPKSKRKGFACDGRDLTLPEPYKKEFARFFASWKDIRSLWRVYGNKLQYLRNSLLNSDVNSINGKNIFSKCTGRRRAKEAQSSAVHAYFHMDVMQLTCRIKELRGRSLAYTIEDLELPYALFQAGYYYDSYKIYEMLAPEMWKRRRYALFFICLFNKKSVAWPAIREIEDRKDMDTDEIRRFYYACDLTKELNMLPLSECVHAMFSDLIYQHQLSDALIKASNTSGRIAQQRKRAEERTGWSLNYNVNKIFTNFVRIFDFCVDNYLVSDNNDIGEQFYVTEARAILDSVLTPENGPQSKLKALNELTLYVLLFKLSSKNLKELLGEVVNGKMLPVTEDFMIALNTYVNNLYELSEKTGKYEDVPIRLHVLQKWLHNILLVVPYIENVPEIEHLDKIIARFWKNAKLSEMIKECAVYFSMHAPSSKETAEVLVYNALDCCVHNGDVVNFLMAISKAVKEYNIQWDKTRLMRGVEWHGSIEIAAVVLYLTGDLMESQLKACIFSQAKSLYDVVSAQSLIKEKILTADVFNNYKSNLYNEQTPYEDYNLISLLVNFYHSEEPDYNDIKECIDNLAKELPSLKFALNPLGWPDFTKIDKNWMGYITEDLYPEILRNEQARKKLKEYADSVSWGHQIKKAIWKLL